MASIVSRVLLLALTTLSLAASAQQSVQVPSLDPPGGPALQLPAFWFAANATGPRPAVVLLHGCGGPYGKQQGQLSERMRSYASLLNTEGWHVLVTDSLTPRGERELCTQRTGTRAVTQTQRRRDALGALRWLAARPDVDPQRLVLLGWSNGGSTVLASTRRNHPEVARSDIAPRAAVAFYPGCETDFQAGYRPTAPLLLLVGGSDDWTPPQACVRLTEAAGGAAGTPPVQLQVYPGAYHGFDGDAPVRLRRDVPNGAQPGAGVHVGADPAAREASRERLLDFLHEQLK
ncbi:dienelactone hydrolase family protein [Ideonella sp. BN130291]|uniref:dienelactone hydrolase family protein n=1 Tax=Ideonella sp. BN130291 TaxID=3112940 RepID=UPI002E25AA72|nr:dienelactone hydrolase family protein [Ideonella sp. BN130291]